MFLEKTSFGLSKNPKGLWLPAATTLQGTPPTSHQPSRAAHPSESQVPVTGQNSSLGLQDQSRQRFHPPPHPTHCPALMQSVTR